MLRSVCLTSTVGKILKLIIKEEIASHLENLNVLKPNQQGFRGDKSHLIIFLNVISGIDSQNLENVVTFDLQKVFEKMVHNWPKHKLRACGVKRCMLVFIEDWLVNRRWCQTKQVFFKLVGCNEWHAPAI